MPFSKFDRSLAVTRQRHEANSKTRREHGTRFRISGFGFLSDFGFRISDFRRPIRLLSSRGLILLSLLCLAVPPVAAQTVLLNEIQTANGTTLSDENGDTPDWIELHNPGADAVDLTGWGLSDNPTNAFKWTFHGGSIAPGGFLLAYASNKDRQPGQWPATNPAALPGLQVWLRADAVNAGDPSQVRSGGGVYVKRWEDQTGHALDAAQASDANQPRYIAAEPGLDGQPVLRFDGVDDQLLLPSVPAQNSFCLIVVARSFAGHEIDQAGANGVGGVSGQRYLFGAAHGGDFNAGAGLSLGTNGASVYEHGSGYMPALAVVGAMNPGFVIVSVNYSNRQPFLAVQGGLTSVGAVSSRAIVTAPREIGAGAYGAFSGDVAEILVFDHTLSELELRGVEEHLRVKYGLAFPQIFHTNFTLDKDGEAVFLTRPDGQPADTFASVLIPRDVSYGRQPDGSTNLVFFDRPTPGAPNATPGAREFLGPPQFSAAAGFYTTPVSLTLMTTNVGAEVRYTLDGSEPTASSPQFATPLALGSRQGVPNDISTIPTAGGWQPPLGEVKKIHVVRARAFRGDALSSPTVTRTYCIDPRGRSRYGLPVVSLATDRANFFDANIGIYVCGNTPGCNYAQAGDAWERPVHVEFFETNGALAFAQESGVRMHGNTSFGFPIKALRLHPLNQKGGEPFRYKIFPDLPITEFDRLLLRPSGHDHYLTMMRDGLMQSLARELGLDMQGYRPAIVFLNGEYWGVHNLQEAFEKNYFANHHPEVDANALDYLEGYAPGAFAYEGDSKQFDALITFMQTNNLSQATNMAFVESLMEVNNYLDYKAVETFYYRWDIGNQRVWRPREPGGRLRWILFDCDVGYGGFWAQPANAPWTFNMLAYNLEPNGPWMNYQPGNDHNAPIITLQLRALMANPGFKRDFINRCADLMNTTLSTSRMTNFINRMAAEIAPEMAEHCARWRAPADWAAWTNAVAWLHQFAINRPEYMRRQITNQFRLRGWVTVTLKMNDTNAGAIQCNSLTLRPSTNAPWSGLYFRDNSVAFSAVPADGYYFKNWQGILGPPATNMSNSFLLNSALTLTANFEALPATNPPSPAPFDLAAGPYVFTRWDAGAPAGSYPPNMLFWQTPANAAADPDLGAACATPWTLPYDRASRSRITGLGEGGIAFLNTSDPQTDGGGYLGAAVLALKTVGRTNALVSWRGGTVTPSARAYAIRLQWRAGATNAFTDLLDAQGRPVEYTRNSLAGHAQILGPFPLPPAALNQPYIQLRWKYYFVSGASGARDQLRLDDIVVAEALSPPRFASVTRPGNGTMQFEFTGVPSIPYTVETSTNLHSWSPLSVTPASAQGVILLPVTPAPAEPARFYRLRWP